MKSTFRLVKIAGIEVGIHYSWFVVLALFSWWIPTRFLPDVYPGWSEATYWITGVVAALLMFVSVLIHELAHSLVALSRGIRVQGITLFLLGGVSSLKAEARGARDEFIISVVGPLASLALVGFLWLALLAFQDTDRPLPAVLSFLALVNMGLAVFNLLPAYPLDGGRVLRSAVWAATGSFSKATVVATLGGQIMGIVLIAVGTFWMLRGSIEFGLWWGLIGWFLYGAAGISRGELKIQARMRGVLVRDVMEADPRTVGPDVPIAETVLEHSLRKGAKAVPVCDGGRLTGIISASDVKRVPRGQWSRVTVGQGMTPVPLWSVDPNDPLAEALELLTEHSIGQVPVMDRGRLVGLLSTADIKAYLRRRKGVGVNPRPASARDATE